MASQLKKATTIDGVEESDQPFSDIVQVYKLFENSTIVLKSPPTLDKSNCYFFCDNILNLERIDNNLTPRYSDNVGGWDFKSHNYNTSYYLGDTYKLIYKRDEGYCFRKQIGGVREFVKINPQPEDKEVVIFKKYSVRNLNNNLCRIIYSLIYKKNPEFAKKVLYQYIHTNPVNSVENNTVISGETNKTNQLNNTDFQLKKATAIRGVEESVKEFSDIMQVYKLFEKSTTVLQSPPTLDKSNCYFFCENISNLERIGNNLTPRYSDNVGDWDFKSHNNHTSYYVGDTYKLIYKRDEGYCIRKQLDGVRKFVKIDPQPEEKEVLIFKKYTVRNFNNSLCRIVYSLISGKNPEFAEKILYQYIGVQSMKTSEKIVKPRRRVKNLSDNLECINKVGDGFVRSVLNIPDNLPPIICYTDDQIADFKTNCKRENIIIGIDSTFNLGSYFLTILTYKNQRIVRKKTGDHPIVFGPILLHENITFENYHYFFSHVAAILESDPYSKIDASRITFGCEHESNVMRAVKSVFKNSLSLLCAKNLEENFTNYLSENCKLNEKIVLKYKTLLFGDGGLMDSQSKLEFDVKSNNLHAEVGDLNDYLSLQYIFEMADQIYNHVCLPKWKLGIPNYWTNNNAESMNYIVSSSVNWQISRTEELIDALRKTVERHYLNVKKGLYGQGDYVLSNFDPIKQTTWHNFRDEKKQDIFKHYLQNLHEILYSKNYEVVRNENVIGNVAEKPEPRKRLKMLFLRASKKAKTN